MAITRILILSAILLATNIMFVGTGRLAAGQETLLPDGSVWIGEQGARLVIEAVTEEGAIVGTLTPSVGCGSGLPRRVSGWYNDGALSFTVTVRECAFVTSWIGQIERGPAPRYIALWQLAFAGPPDWNKLMTGADAFTRQ